MEKTCASCRKPETAVCCGVCQAALCRKCRIFLGDGAFPFLTDASVDLKHAYYCGPCFDEKVAPVKAEYEENLKKAKAVNVLYKGSKSTIRHVRRADNPASVNGSKDRDETILQLAFEAARAGFNSIVDVEISCKKVRNFGWQSSVWMGVGTPAEIKSHQLERDA